jgi:cell division transport system permease protein
MKSLFLHFKQALVEFKKKPVSHFFTIGTVALALLLAGTVFLFSRVLQYTSNSWGSGAMVAVYLEKGASLEKINSIKKRISTMEGVKSVNHVSPKISKKRLLSSLKKDAVLIKDVEPGFFPNSLEVVVRGSTSVVEQTQEKLKKLNGIVSGITDIKGVHTWNKKIGYIIDILMLLGVVMLSMVVFASGYVIMSTIRLSIETKIEELKIVKFLGASPSFIQTPILLEGLLHGLFGAIIAFGMLYALAHFTFPFLGAIVGNTLPATDSLVFFTPYQLLMGLAIASFTGLIAGKLALSTVEV